MDLCLCGVGRICSLLICSHRGLDERPLWVDGAGSVRRTSRMYPHGLDGDVLGGVFVVAGVGSRTRLTSRKALYEVDGVENRVGLLVAVVQQQQMLVVVVDQWAGQLDTAVVGHRLHACPYGDAYGLRGDCHDTRGSLAGCLHRATISAFRFRSSQSGKWNVAAAP